jgi:acid phosphatase (class A)
MVLAGLAAGMPGALARPAGYLSSDVLDVVAVLPPAPVAGEARYENDRAVFRVTRRFLGSPRWDLATRDARLGTAEMLQAYGCAVGVTLSEQALPNLVQLVERASTDSAHAAGVAKEHFKRQRPFLIDQGEICQPREELAGSYDYPSGHTTRGWTWAAILAELAPDRATAILARGRSFGESRIVCGAHNASAVEAGRLTAASVLVVEHANRDFQADLVRARTELEELRADAGAPRPQGCDAEAALVALPVF